MNLRHHCTLAAGLICVVLALTASSIAHGKDEGMLDSVRRTPTYDHFTMGLYIASSEKVLDVPLSKVFKDFLARGVELVWINSYNYYPLARQKKLNQYAKANGV